MNNFRKQPWSFNVSKRIQLFFFWMEQISNPGNSSSHKLLSPFFPSESKRHSWARRKPDFLLQLSYILEIFSTFNHKWWIHPAQSLQTVHGWPLKAQWRPGILAILLSLSILCSLSIVYVYSFLFFFLFFFCFFISYIWLILNFYCFAISLLRHCFFVCSWKIPNRHERQAPK